MSIDEYREQFKKEICSKCDGFGCEWEGHEKGESDDSCFAEWLEEKLYKKDTALKELKEILDYVLDGESIDMVIEQMKDEGITLQPDTKESQGIKKGE